MGLASPAAGEEQAALYVEGLLWKPVPHKPFSNVDCYFYAVSGAGRCCTSAPLTNRTHATVGGRGGLACLLVVKLTHAAAMHAHGVFCILLTETPAAQMLSFAWRHRSALR